MRQKQAKSVLNKQKQRDSWFLTEYSVNAYEGCSCNCLYCYIRGSKYGENMDNGLAVKSNVLEVLEKQLQAKAKKGQYGIVVVGSATDAYLHHEEKWRLTEGMLKLFLKYRFPVFISTKSTLVLRDVALLKQIDKAAILPEDLKASLGRGVILSTSLSMMNEQVARVLEPGAATPIGRLKMLQQLKQQDFLCGVNAIPILPFISDTEEELEKIISSARGHGADYILVGGLTLFGKGPADSKTLYYEFLKRYDPSLIPKYEKMYGSNFFPPKKYQQELKLKAERICAKYNIRTAILDQHVETS
jgi:DNA repair photolyase